MNAAIMLASLFLIVGSAARAKDLGSTGVSETGEVLSQKTAPRGQVAGFVYKAASGDYYLLKKANSLEKRTKIVFDRPPDKSFICVMNATNTGFCEKQAFSYIATLERKRFVYNHAILISSSQYQSQKVLMEIYGH